jgi:predicted regulator of Ras-like GTPase activity (Roadblock/LC7/MglB family)
MQPLRFVLSALAGRPDVAGAAVLSDEGLVVDAALPQHLDRDEVAALATTAIRHLNALTDSIGHGQLRQVVLDSELGTAILTRLPSGASLLVLATADGDLGQLLYDLRRHSPALAPLV